ncbi:hypothetical protein GCM10009682_38450 [Luedemannella flava]|uniref:Secreted protein n=1 Tax=Luedemannella flava TaxID=349316 RepID=A0ABN2M9F7_9ACTN
MVAILGSTMAVIPASAAFAVGTVIQQNVATGLPGSPIWRNCRDAANRVEYIFLEELSSVCGSGGTSQVYGWAGLQTNSATSHTLYVCVNRQWHFANQINPATATGGASGTVLSYNVTYPNPCRIEDKGYPIRKFKGAFTDAWGNVSYSPFWVAPL